MGKSRSPPTSQQNKTGRLASTASADETAQTKGSLVEKHVTQWACDRCGVAAEDLPYRGQPENWIGLVTFEPPSHAEGSARLHLCTLCADDLRRWLDGDADMHDIERLAS